MLLTRRPAPTLLLALLIPTLTWVPGVLTSPAEAATCSGYRSILDIEGIGAKIQECEKSYESEASPGSTKTPAQECLRKADPSGNLEAIVYRVSCEDFCSATDLESDRKACYIVKANARKARALANGHSLQSLDQLKAQAASTTGSSSGIEYWQAYSTALKVPASTSAKTASSSRPVAAPSPPPPSRKESSACSRFKIPTHYFNDDNEKQACAAKKRKVHFTFDDGPAGALTTQALQTLKEKKVSATFFVMGERVASNAKILRTMRDEGHTIGCHGHSHKDHSRLGEASLKAQADECAEAARNSDAAPFMTAIHRLPYGAGANREAVKSAYQAAGFEKHLAWNVDTLDWEASHRTNPKLTLQSLLDGLCRSGGGTVLFHDIHATTVNQLPDLIDATRCAGFEFGDLESVIGAPLPLIGKKGKVPDPRCSTPSSNRFEVLEQLSEDVGKADSASIEDLY